ncbi:hypothetical protein [Streptomyces sp. NBC_00009]|uniref:hypothetical protein n=1 Tax=Streptomyces sp. NBC_00009 TaxID=2975620 RepID=UPI0032539F22
MTAPDSASARPRRTALLGQGYVGLALAIRAADAGHRVVGFDTDDTRVKRLRAAQSPSPDIPDSQVAAALTNGTYTPLVRVLHGQLTVVGDDLGLEAVSVGAGPVVVHDVLAGRVHVTAHADDLAGFDIAHDRITPR